MKFLEGMWFEVYDGLYNIIKKEQKGSTTWLAVMFSTSTKSEEDAKALISSIKT